LKRKIQLGSFVPLAPAKGDVTRDLSPLAVDILTQNRGKAYRHHKQHDSGKRPRVSRRNSGDLAIEKARYSVAAKKKLQLSPLL
jgi:hypothetical protein